MRPLPRAGFQSSRLWCGTAGLRRITRPGSSPQSMAVSHSSPIFRRSGCGQRSPMSFTTSLSTRRPRYARGVVAEGGVARLS